MPPRIEIIGDAEKATPFIIWAKREWSLREGRWFKHTGTCLIELFRSGDMGFIRLIPETVNGFVGHPRTGKLKLIPFWDNQMNQKYLTGVDGGGYLEKSGAWEEIANRDVYPLTDNEMGTFLLERDVEWLGNTDNYGNCWWSDGESTVSWKSNPNWHFSIDSSINIPGLSRPENKVGELIYYTCFSNNIYAEGDVLAVGPVTPTALGSLVYEPSLVAGAWYLNGILMCCSVVNKVDTLGGYWLGVYKQDGEGWLLVATEYSTTRLHTPAFISKDGKSLVHADKRYTINADITEVLQTDLRTVENTGSRTIVGAGGYGSTYSYKSSYEYWAGMNKSTEPEMSLVSTKADFGYSSVGNTTTQTKMVPVYRGNPATEVSIEATIKPTYIEYRAIANGSYCGVIWEGVSSSVENTAILNIDRCVDKDYTVSATLVPNSLMAVHTYSNVLTEPVIVGPDRILGTTQFSVTGGTGPYTWSASTGSISADGLYTPAPSLCGSDIISIVDSCGVSDRHAVVLAGGKWVVANSGSFGCHIEDGIHSADCYGGWAASFMAICSPGSCFVYTDCWYSTWGCAYTTCPVVANASSQNNSVSTTTGLCGPTAPWLWPGRTFAHGWALCEWVCTSDPRPAVDPNHM